MSSLAERFAALPEWAQVWVVDDTNDWPDACVWKQRHYYARVGGWSQVIWFEATSLFDYKTEVLLCGENITRLEAAEAMAAHRAGLEAEGDE